MPETHFFTPATGVTFADVAAAAGVALPEGADPSRPIGGAAPLESAGPTELAYMDNARYAEALTQTRAGICLVGPRFAARVPVETVAIVCRDPYRIYA